MAKSHCLTVTLGNLTVNDQNLNIPQIIEFQSDWTYSLTFSLFSCFLSAFIKHHPRNSHPKYMVAPVVLGGLRYGSYIVVGHHCHVSLQLKFQLDSPGFGEGDPGTGDRGPGTEDQGPGRRLRTRIRDWTHSSACMGGCGTHI